MRGPMSLPLRATVVSLIAALCVVGVPAHAAPVTPSVTLTADPATVTKGDLVQFVGTVSGPSQGARVQLQVRAFGRWDVVRKDDVGADGGYLMKRTIHNATDRYRVLVLANDRVLSATSPVVTVRSTPKPPPPLAGENLSELRYRLAHLIDQYRRDHGLRGVSTRAVLHDYAQQWSDTQARAGASSARGDFSDEPQDYDVEAELVTLNGHPKAVLASLKETSPDALLGDFSYFGIGMSLKDENTGYWTIDLAVKQPPKVWTEDEVRQLILDQTNDFRAENGLPALEMMPELDTVAQDWTRHMAEEDDFRHNPHAFEQYPPGWTSGAENIAAGFAPDDVVQGWINSPPHRGNILSNATHIGIGYATNKHSTYTRYYTQNFALYQDEHAPETPQSGQLRQA